MATYNQTQRREVPTRPCPRRAPDNAVVPMGSAAWSPLQRVPSPSIKHGALSGAERRIRQRGASASFSPGWREQPAKNRQRQLVLHPNVASHVSKKSALGGGAIGTRRWQIMRFPYDSFLELSRAEAGCGGVPDSAGSIRPLPSLPSACGSRAKRIESA